MQIILHCTSLTSYAIGELEEQFHVDMEWLKKRMEETFAQQFVCTFLLFLCIAFQSIHLKEIISEDAQQGAFDRLTDFEKQITLLHSRYKDESK